ncbi:mitogen-activated protein kinase kinase kinase 14 [Leptodactylus fuscus]|uniref:mitogen-activated protein kinase kinase kinase 14 n=1 Tax=Leptodactylus fuscus TaxID=238119 RepID=UPI003F4F1668
MAIDCHDGQKPVSTKTPLHCHKLIKPLETVEKTTESGITNALLQNKDGHWAKLLLKGTATETKESPALGISIIAQPECENNPEICPTSQEGPLYITASKQYSLNECNEHIPNNVVNATEGKLAQPLRFPKGKKKRRKRSIKNSNATSPKRSQSTPEQETLTPIPVQDEESQSTQWHKDDMQNHCSIQLPKENVEYPPPKSQPYADDNQKSLHRLINPSQYIYHVGAGKLQPSIGLLDVPQYRDKLSEIIAALGLDDFEHNFISKLSSSKFPDSYMDSKTQSVEEGVLWALKDSVSCGEPHNLCTLVKSWKKSADEEEHVGNEGILLNEELEMVDYEYKKGIHWTKSEEVLGCGAFGDVFLGKDNRTGFKFAAKTIHISKFRSEELTCCLAVPSEKLIPVYGAVREGPWITVFMKHMKGGPLGQLIKRSGFLEENWALYYTGQVLQGLQHLHAANILHGDIKADNVLLSDDGKTAYLCDFGHAAHLPGGCKTQLLTGDYVPGTETHMAPEIVRGEPCDTKIDVWSACCMLLHMLNGWHPWSRTHKAPLCLKIATEPPPLQEIPPSCHSLTRNIIVDGLQKDPSNRADTVGLIKKVDIALRKIGGLKSSYNTAYREPRIFPPTFTDVPIVPDQQLKTIHEEVMPVQNYSIPHITEDVASHRSVEQAKLPCEMEIERLELDLYMENLSQPFLLEECEQMSEPSLELLHSRKDSLTTLDTKSSGIHSWDSQMDPWSLQSGSFFSGGNTTTPSWLTGIKVHLKSFSGEILYIWESGRTKLGDLAVGISSQIPIKSFTIVNSQGNLIPWDTDIADCGIELQCSLAPDRGNWLWRVKKGKIEEGNTGEVYSGGGTDAPTLWTPA